MNQEAIQWINELKECCKNSFFNPYSHFYGDFKEMKPIAAEKMLKRKECYSNSIKIACSIPNAQYIEGFLFYCGIPISHAWNIIDGIAIDYTHKPTEKDYYFGTPIPIEYVLEAIDHRRWTSSNGVLDTLRKMNPFYPASMTRPKI